MGSHSSHGGRERWSDSNYILKVELIGFHPGLGVVFERKRVVKDDSMIWGLNRWRV